MEDRELTFWEHLDVLRWALVRIVCLWFVLAIGFFIAMPYIFDPVIMGPCHDDFVFYGFLRKIGEVFNLTGDFFTQKFDIKLQNINLAAPFFVHLTTSFVLSIIILVPYIFWEIWLFIRPALYTNEAAGVRKALLLGNVMFYVGMAVGYFMVYPLALRFLATYDLSDNIDTLISLNSYIDNFMMLVLAMGIAFELPLVTWLLSLFGLLTRSTLREYRRHAVVVIVIAAAIITPTGDPFTLTAVALPLYALYELSIFMVKEDKEEEDEDEDDKPAGSGGDSKGPKPALEKKPDGGDPVAPDADAKEVKAEDRDISETFRIQREAAQQAKVEAKNKALQERLDKAAAAAGVATAGAVEAVDAQAADATGAVSSEGSDGTVKELTANTDQSVKDALAEASTAAKVVKKKREPRMVIIDDQIYFEEGPEVEEEEEIAEEKPAEEKPAEEMPTEEASETSQTSESSLSGESSNSSESSLSGEPSNSSESGDSSSSSDSGSSSEPSPSIESTWEDPYTQEPVNQPEALQTPYYDDPEAMPDLSNYYAERRIEMAEEEAAETSLTSVSSPTNLSSPTIPSIPSSPSSPTSPSSLTSPTNPSSPSSPTNISSPSSFSSSSSNAIVEQARQAAENARLAAEQAVKAAQEAARIAEETAKAAEAAAKAAAEQAAKAAAEEAAKVAAEEAAKAAAKPTIDVSGIRYDYARFNQ